MLLALPTIQRQKPALLRDTWEELWKLHRAQLSKRIYTDSLTEPSVPKKKEPPSEKKEGNSGISLILVAGVGVFATLLAGRAALKLREKALAERTVLEKQIETIHAALGGVENSKKLIEDLQLGVSGKSLDPARREIAYKKIIEIARVSGNVRSVLKNIRVLIGVDT